jgi:hypothetical protein
MMTDIISLKIGLRNRVLSNTRFVLAQQLLNNLYLRVTCHVYATGVTYFSQTSL